MDHEIQNAKFEIHIFEVGLSVVLADSIDVFTHTMNVWVQLTYVLTWSIKILVQSTCELAQSVDVLT
jgi:hypothetical protein